MPTGLEGRDVHGVRVMESELSEQLIRCLDRDSHEEQIVSEVSSCCTPLFYIICLLCNYFGRSCYISALYDTLVDLDGWLVRSLVPLALCLSAESHYWNASSTFSVCGETGANKLNPY
jgi:hypothetical protein